MSLKSYQLENLSYQGFDLEWGSDEKWLWVIFTLHLPLSPTTRQNFAKIIIVGCDWKQKTSWRICGRILKMLLTYLLTYLLGSLLRQRIKVNRKCLLLRVRFILLYWHLKTSCQNGLNKQFFHLFTSTTFANKQMPTKASLCQLCNDNWSNDNKSADGLIRYFVDYFWKPLSTLCRELCHLKNKINVSASQKK